MIHEIEMQERILALLEEAGGENVYCALNSTTDPTGSSEEVKLMANALRVLSNMALVKIGVESTKPKHAVRWLEAIEIAESIDALPRKFEFDHAGSLWTTPGNQPHDAEMLYVALTNDGKKRARNVLDSRGFLWWDSRFAK